MIENYEHVREAIARWMGCTFTPTDWGGFWKYPDGAVVQQRGGPDPLNNPADAWELQCAIVDVPVHECDMEAIVEESNEGNCYLCAILTDDDWKQGKGKTPAEALVRAWMAAFGGEA